MQLYITIFFIIKSKFSWNLTKCFSVPCSLANQPPPLPLHISCQTLTGFSWVLAIPWSRAKSLGVQPWELGDLRTGGIYCICWADSKKTDNVSYLKVRSPFPLLPGSAPSPSDSSPLAVLSRYLFLSLPLVSGYFSAAARCLDSKSWVSVLGRNNVAAALEGFSVNRWLIVNKVQSQWLVCGVQ